MYNVTEIANSSTALEMMQGVNDGIMFGGFGSLILFFMGGILFITFLKYTGDGARSISGTLFILFLTSLLMRAMSLIPDTVLFTLLVLTPASLLLIRK